MTRPPRPRQRRKDARPDEILAAARIEFAEQGFARSSIASIAQRAGVARGTVYLYFDSKDAILRALIRDSIGQTIDGVQAMVGGRPAPGIATGSSDFRALFTRALDLIYTRVIDGDAALIAQILVADGHTMPDIVAFYRHEIMARGESVLRALIEQGIASGDLHPACRDTDVRLMVAPCFFAALWRRVFDRVDPLDLDAYRAGHVQLVLDALYARRGETS